MNRLVVQKYGGSSVATPDLIRRVARRIVSVREQGSQVVAVVSAMGSTTNKLISLAERIAPRPPDRELDMLVATGEQASAALLAMAIKSLGHSAVSFTGQQVGIITDSSHTKARILKVDAERIQKSLEAGNIVIVAGFQGMTDALEITTLGRGGSDITAVVLAAALKADVCEKLTDESGVFTADPRKIPTARRLDALSYEEMLELASLGTKLLHPRAVECAMKNGVRLHVRTSFSEEEGTWIQEEDRYMEKAAVCGITYDVKEAKVSVLDLPDRPGVAGNIFSALAAVEINVDVIVLNRTRGGLTDLSFTLPRSDLEKGVRILKDLARKEGYGEVIAETEIAKVSIIGAGMRSHPGVAARMFEALAGVGINIGLISTSEIKVSCVIDRDRLDDALQTVYKAFDMDMVPAVRRPPKRKKETFGTSF
ncbi:MAG TPA: aspartate kinase [Candidatus Ozemobacteraceae bacterium]|nr:aspartate kinase [Candidatus Ozemobacteraceae bacterium]